MNNATIRHLFLVSACIAFATGCARREPEGTEAGAGAPAPQVEAPAPEVAAVKIDVSLTPAAEQRLAAAGEGVRVQVTYAGDPAPGQESAVNELGLVELGGSVHALPGAGTVSLPIEAVDAAKLGLIVGQPQLMVNATSGSAAAPTGLLACPFYWDTLSKAGDEGVSIACDVAPAE